MATKKKPVVTKALDVEATHNALNKAQLEVQKVFATLGTSVLAQFDEFDKIKNNVEAKKAELKELFDIEVAAETLEKTRDTIKMEKDCWEEEYAKGQLEREREAEHYEYELEKKKQKDMDDLLEMLNKTEKAYRADWEKKEADLRERHSQLSAQEKEFERLKQFESDFESKLSKEKSVAVNAAVSNVKRELDFEIRTLTNQLETQKEVFAKEKASLEKEIAGVHEANTQLRRQVTELNETIKQLSVGSATAIANAVSDAVAKSR